EEILGQKKSSYWDDTMEEAGVPEVPIHSYDQASKDPHFLARDMIVEVEHPAAGKIKMLGIPAKMSQTPGQIRFPAPILGQHTEDVLKGLLNLTDHELEELRNNDAI